MKKNQYFWKLGLRNGILKNGQIMVITIVFLAAILILSASLFSRLALFLHSGAAATLKEQGTSIAEAGVDYAVWFLNKNPGTDPPTAETAVGTTGTFILSTQTNSSTSKTITSTAYIPNSANPRIKKSLKLDIGVNSQIISFAYAVQVGNGGLSMGQSSKINGSNGAKGSVYTNGSITGNNGSIITGDAWAVGTISNPPQVQGTPHPGASPTTMPQFDYNQWETAANQGTPIDCNVTPSLCSLSGNVTIGNKMYINGSISLAQGTIVDVTGPVYIRDGNLNLGQSSQLNLDNSFGSNSTALVLNGGTVSVGQSAQINPTSANPKGYIMLATTSNQNSAISIGQSGANAIFYALNGGVNLGQSANATAVIAKSLSLNQSAILTYDTGLASTNISSGSGGSWQIVKGTYRFTNSP